MIIEDKCNCKMGHVILFSDKPDEVQEFQKQEECYDKEDFSNIYQFVISF